MKIYINIEISNSFTQLFIPKNVKQIPTESKNVVKMRKNVGQSGVKWGIFMYL